MNDDADLIRYQVLAANRRHFSALFFAVVAFSWAMGLGLWTALKWAYPGFSALAFLAAGATLIAGAFIAWRLLKRERSSFDAMCACWRRISGGKPAARTGSPNGPGAMALVTAAQLAMGISVLAAGIALI